MAPSPLTSSPIVLQLLHRTPPPPLAFPKSAWRPELSPQIDALAAPLPVRAALHLLNDDFGGCHDLAQTDEANAYCNHLHAIAHRREPDYWNSKYWIARISHPHLSAIYLPDQTPASTEKAREAARRFVDEVEAFATSRNRRKAEAEAEAEGMALRERQWKEMTALAEILIAEEEEVS